ncbi:MAG: cold shock domain-containing protein, partial [Actinobacteria bacterium]|nr:cold shock domain-containing protein [Actinomycetota bacterium]
MAQALENIEGQVKWFDPRKGFGFIVGPEGQDIFVHFSVIEQDSGSPDQQAGILIHLGERAPLALAVSSGGKSLHGWF